MVKGIWNQDWLSQNANRAYPLAQDATRLDATGSFTVPNDFLVGLKLPVAAGADVEPGKFFVRRIGSYGNGYTVTIGYAGDDGDVDVATGVLSREAHTENQTYNLGGLGDFYDSRGFFTVGVLDAIDEQPTGFWTFDLAGGRLETDAIVPDLRGVSALIVVNGTSRSAPITGDVELVALANIQLVPSLVSDEDPQIGISAIQGEGLISDCGCGGPLDSPPIRRIDGISPTAAGDFTLLAGTCLEFTELANGLQLNNPCSKPCCGCPDTVAINAKLQELGDQVVTLRTFLGRLESSVQTMDSTVLSTKLNDRGCVQC